MALYFECQINKNTLLQTVPTNDKFCVYLCSRISRRFFYKNSIFCGSASIIFLENYSIFISLFFSPCPFSEGDELHSQWGWSSVEFYWTVDSRRCGLSSQDDFRRWCCQLWCKELPQSQDEPNISLIWFPEILPAVSSNITRFYLKFSLFYQNNSPVELTRFFLFTLPDTGKQNTICERTDEASPIL